MVEIWLPYGSSEISARVPEERLVEILRPNPSPKVSSPIEQAKRLIQSNDIFQNAAKSAKRICIVLGACGNKELAHDSVKLFVAEANPAGSPATILCPSDTVEVDQSSFQPARIVHHNPASSPTVETPKLKSPFPVQLNSDFLSADLRIVIGELKPHHFLKYSGLCDAVFPSLASRDSLDTQLYDRTGITLPDIYRERLEITNSVGNLFALGFVLDNAREPCQIEFGHIGDCIQKLESGVNTAYAKDVRKEADIVVMGAGGSPADQSLLQAVETLPAGLTAAKKDGVLIIASECGRGHGGGRFYEWSAEKKEARYLEARLRHRFNYDGLKAAFLARVLQDHRVYLVSTIPDYHVERTFGMKPARTVNAALQTAQRTRGLDSTISVVPDASRVVPVRAESAK